MSICTIIIFGANGMLGQYLSSYFATLSHYRVIRLTRKEYDVTERSISLLETFLLKYPLCKTTCIINCIGLIPQKEQIGSNPYYLINSIFPQHLSNICKKYNTKLICPTTDCVFSGSKGDYIENDFHDETSPYGISKSLGEPSDATVIRVSIIGEELKKSSSFLEFVKSSKGNINGYANHFWNGITCLQYCKIIEQICKHNLFWKGVRHLYSPQKKSKYELACMIKDTYQLSTIIHPFHTASSIDKTLSSIHDTCSLFAIPPLEEQIVEQAWFRLT